MTKLSDYVEIAAMEYLLETGNDELDARWIAEFFQDSGVFIYPSILVLALGLSIAIERFIYISRARSTNRKMWDDILPMLQAGKFQQVFSITAKSDTAIGMIVNNGLGRVKSARRREDIDAAMEEGMMEIVPRLEKRTHYLATLANVVTLLGLLGLLLAFSFGIASSRFDTRRQLVIEEANDIGTVILRTDFFPDSTRRLLRNSLQEYVEARIAFYESGMDMDRTTLYYLRADSLGKHTWDILTRYARHDNFTTKTSEIVPALNAMIDIATTRRAAGESTIPDSIMYFLFVLCFCSAFLLGYDNKHKIDWIVVIGFAVMLSVTVLTILDLDRPRGGFINMDRPNQKIIELREMFR